jgi:hypothetical protein
MWVSFRHWISSKRDEATDLAQDNGQFAAWIGDDRRLPYIEGDRPLAEQPWPVRRMAA